MKLRLTPRICSSARDFSTNPDLDVLFKYAGGRATCSFLSRSARLARFVNREDTMPSADSYPCRYCDRTPYA
jgi:hypothetical protein